MSSTHLPPLYLPVSNVHLPNNKIFWKIACQLTSHFASFSLSILFLPVLLHNCYTYTAVNCTFYNAFINPHFWRNTFLFLLSISFTQFLAQISQLLPNEDYLYTSLKESKHDYTTMLWGSVSCKPKNNKMYQKLFIRYVEVMDFMKSKAWLDAFKAPGPWF